jgi:hypothetical protein
MTRKRLNNRPTITLDQEALAFARSQQAMIAHYQRVVASLESAMMRYLEGRYHINLKEESWSLDTEEGTLKRVLGESDLKSGDRGHE